MNEYVIATASTCDLSSVYLYGHNVPFISYTYEIDGEVFQDDCRSETKRNLIAAMREGKMPNTSQITEYAYYEFFKGILEEGNDLIYTDMSRAVSSSIANAERAIAKVKEEYPDRKIHFIDSYCITGGLALFIKQLVQCRNRSMTFEETVEWGEAHKREFIHRFMVDDLQWLRKGGRLSNASAIVGSLLSIKPLLYIKNDGKLVAIDKIRGRKKCLKALIDSMKDDIADITYEEEMYIIHTDQKEEAEQLRTDLCNHWPGLKEENISIMRIGPVIGAHVGPGFMAIAYHGKNRIM